MFLDKILIENNEINLDSLKELPEGMNIFDAMVIEIKDNCEAIDQIDQTLRSIISIQIQTQSQLNLLKKKNLILEIGLLLMTILIAMVVL